MKMFVRPIFVSALLVAALAGCRGTHGGCSNGGCGVQQGPIYHQNMPPQGSPQSMPNGGIPVVPHGGVPVAPNGNVPNGTVVPNNQLNANPNFSPAPRGGIPPGGSNYR